MVVEIAATVPHGKIVVLVGYDIATPSFFGVIVMICRPFLVQTTITFASGQVCLQMGVLESMELLF